jgi:SHS2 domain-containing protein
MDGRTRTYRRYRTESGRQSDPVWIRWLEHTGDAGLTVRAPTCGRLFARAAWGMFALLTDMAAVEPRQFHDVEASAPDRDALLVRWLSELNFLHATRGMVFSRFHVTCFGPTQLRARAEGEPIDPGRHAVRTEIKAVTYHRLAVRRVGRIWTATVLFDL